MSLPSPSSEALHGTGAYLTHVSIDEERNGHKVCDLFLLPRRGLTLHGPTAWTSSEGGESYAWRVGRPSTARMLRLNLEPVDGEPALVISGDPISVPLLDSQFTDGRRGSEVSIVRLHPDGVTTVDYLASLAGMIDRPDREPAFREVAGIALTNLVY